MGDVGREMFTPRQTPTQYRQTDPFKNLKPQQQAFERMLGASTAGSRVGQVGNPFVGPGPEQQRALGALEQFQAGATPAFGTGVGTIEKTAGGGYLDPAQSAPFQRMSDARLNLARQMFSDFAPQYSSSAGAAGTPFRSSAREAGIQRGAERIGTQAAQDVATAGWQQYAAERQAQEQAARVAAGLAPGLAESVFGAGEKLRSAEQQANTAQLEGRLRAMGLDEESLRTVLSYLKLASGETLKHIPGESPYGEWSGVVKDVGKVGLGAYTGGASGALGGLS